MSLFAIILRPETPATLLTLTREFLQDHEPPFLSSRSFSHDGVFASLELVRGKEDDNTFVVKVPAQYVLFVAELAEDQTSSIGFLP